MAFKLNNLLNKQPAQPQKKRGRPKKLVETAKPSTPTKQTIPKAKQNIPKTSKQITEPKPTTKTKNTTKLKSVPAPTPTIVNTNTAWNKTINKQPDPLRPILFNTKCKKLVTGYKLRNGFVTNAPYFINQFKKETGYIEWKYISYCTTIERCPKEFPNCSICKHSKLQKPIGGK